MARVQANLVEWMDDKGYGFARLPGGTERIFVHANSRKKGVQRLRKGDELELEIIEGRQGRPAAKNVRVLDAAEVARQLPYHLVTAVMLMILAQLVVVTGHAPFELTVIYALMGLLSLYLYSHDKQAALFGWWRISENRLLLVDLFGGIVGGLLAQHRYRHKKSKPSYQIRIFAIVVIHAVFLGALGSGLITPVGIADLIRAFG